jgi:hypothetical protein
LTCGHDTTRIGNAVGEPKACSAATTRANITATAQVRLGAVLAISDDVTRVARSGVPLSLDNSNK